MYVDSMKIYEHKQSWDTSVGPVNSTYLQSPAFTSFNTIVNLVRGRVPKWTRPLFAERIETPRGLILPIQHSAASENEQ